MQQELVYKAINRGYSAVFNSQLDLVAAAELMQRFHGLRTPENLKLTSQTTRFVHTAVERRKLRSGKLRIRASEQSKPEGYQHSIVEVKTNVIWHSAACAETSADQEAANQSIRKAEKKNSRRAFKSSWSAKQKGAKDNGKGEDFLSELGRAQNYNINVDHGTVLSDIRSQP